MVYVAICTSCGRGASFMGQEMKAGWRFCIHCDADGYFIPDTSVVGECRDTPCVNPAALVEGFPWALVQRQERPLALGQ